MENYYDSPEYKEMDYMMEVEEIAYDYDLTLFEAMCIVDLLYPDGEIR